MAAQVTIFTSQCSKDSHIVKELFAKKSAPFTEIDTSTDPLWTQLMFLLTGGNTSLPQIFINGKHAGGLENVSKLDASNILDVLLKQSPPSDIAFPPTLRKPSGDELLEIIPKSLRQKWQDRVNQLDSLLGGTTDSPISSILLMLETPLQMVVVCTAGPGKDIYTVGAAGDKGSDGSEEKLYCQVAIETKQTLFVDDPTTMPGLEKNEDYVKFGYGYYVGAPWIVGDTKGTIVAMEKIPGVLKEEHKAIVEAERDAIEHDLKEWCANNVTIIQ